MPFEENKKSYMDTLFSISTLLKRWYTETHRKDVNKNYMINSLTGWIKKLEDSKHKIMMPRNISIGAVLEAMIRSNSTRVRFVPLPGEALGFGDLLGIHNTESGLCARNALLCCEPVQLGRLGLFLLSTSGVFVEGLIHVSCFWILIQN